MSEDWMKGQRLNMQVATGVGVWMTSQLHIFQLYPQKTWVHIQHRNFRIFLNFLKQLINIVRSLNWLSFILHFHPRGFPISEEVWAQFWTCFKPHSDGRKFIASRPLAPYPTRSLGPYNHFQIWFYREYIPNYGCNLLPKDIIVRPCEIKNDCHRMQILSKDLSVTELAGCYDLWSWLTI